MLHVKRVNGTALLLVGTLLATACATPMSQMTNWRPLVDPQHVTDKWFKDSFECQQLADQAAAQSNAGMEALAGLLLGAGLGAALGGVGGGAGHGAAYGSILGLAAGGGAAAGSATGDYKHVFRLCLRGRGYQVLN